ncbi:glycosyltransferase [uncultured Clostridium sp.]|uniref:glycosyltransferase n=1 Tax=uncultured Clostridium sp. TaxID=59620 RepID=UPI0025D9993D|nr:glycosyltransferase [uncultured Clostridium sp.]
MKVAILIDNSMELNKPHPARVFNEAMSLIHNEFDVTIFCKKGNESTPTKEIYKGIKIIRCFNYFLGTTELIHNYIISHIQLFNTINEKFDVYHCHDTNTLPIGYILSRRDKAKLIFEAHEYFPDQICREWYGSNEFKYDLTRKLIKARGEYYKYADKIITVSETMADVLYKKLNLKEKPQVLYNTRFKDEFIKIKNSIHISLREKFNIPVQKKILLFQGNIEESRGVDIIIKSMKYVSNSVFIAAGAVKEEYYNILKSIIIAENLEDIIYFTGSETSERLLQYTYDADILIYLGKPIIQNMEYTIPNKFFDYLFSCKPIILSDLCSLKNIMQKYNVGINVNTHDIDIKSIGKNINSFINNYELLSKISENMLKIRNLYTWENEEVKLLSLYNKLFKR